MDAQQRLLLESAYEVLSQTGNTAGKAACTAVMVGIGTVDYVPMSEHLGNGIYVASGSFVSSRSPFEILMIYRQLLKQMYACHFNTLNTSKTKSSIFRTWAHRWCKQCSSGSNLLHLWTQGSLHEHRHGVLFVASRHPLCST